MEFRTLTASQIHTTEICLWEVTEEEFVGNWSWEELHRIDGWYVQVIFPAFERHNDKHLVGD